MDLLIYVGIASVCFVAGLALGIFVLAPRITRAVDRQHEESVDADE